MFEDDVTVPAGWYPDPMGLPQLRWWNNHAWTELTTEARPPLVVQAPTRLAFADDELPTRRQQREQRERDEEYATLATDENEARDAASARAPLTVTLREIDAPVSDDDEVDKVDDAAHDADREADAEPVGIPAPGPIDPRSVNLDTIDYDSVGSGDPNTEGAVTEGAVAEAFLPRPAFIPASAVPVAERMVRPPATAETAVADAVESAPVAHPTDSGPVQRGSDRHPQTRRPSRSSASA